MSLLVRPREAARPNAAWLSVLLTCAVLAGWPTRALSQAVRIDRVGGLPSTLSVVPPRDPRPVEGPGADQQWQTSREGAEKAPVASFIGALQGNDAALEVVVGQGRLMTLKASIVSKEGTAVIAVGDPTVVGFEVLPNPRMIRLIGKRAGVTDMSVTTADGQTYAFEVHVVYDLRLLRVQLAQIFPDAHLKFGQIREHVIVEGQARSPAQVAAILQTIEAYLESVQIPQASGGARSTPGHSPSTAPNGGQGQTPPPNAQGGQASPGPTGQRAEAFEQTGDGSNTGAAWVLPRIINLIKIPGVQQVMLKVQIAELNRTALREIGADLLWVHPDSGTILGTQIGGATVNALGTLGLGGLVGGAAGATGTNTTGFGIFPSGDFQILLRALRRNSVVRILAEPNLVAMSGHQASFLAGGEFPVPVPQTSGGITNAITIEWKKFGVQLSFTPYVLDNNTVRLTVTPEVSTIDFSLGTTLVVGGDPVPGLNTRRATTTVELVEGQTLAIAGLMQIEIDARTGRIPGLGDLPYIGPLFSNTSHRRVEKELLVMVTPCLIQPMNPCEVPCLPGDEVKDPNDLEFYLMNRIEGRTGRDFRSTTRWDNPCCFVELMKLEQGCVSGPVGFSQ